MKIIVTSKGIFDSLMDINNVTPDNVENEHGKAFFISINDPCGTDEEPYFKENKSNVLVQFFADIDEDLHDTKYGPIKAFTKEQAAELVQFIEANKHRETCIVHCSAGISRSGAVGAFVCDYFKKDYFEFKKENPHILPNGHVLRSLKNAAAEKLR